MNHNSNRLVIEEDALGWLTQHSCQPGSSLVASLPDKSEFPKLTLAEWKHWFMAAAELIMSKTPDDGIAVFYQSDIKVDGVWIDKSYLIMKAAEAVGAELIFHKIICRMRAGTITHGRPAYSHLIAFSKTFRPSADSYNFADVVDDIGEKTWERGMGMNACLFVANFLSRQVKCEVLINPFCGEGSMLAAANARGMNAIGIERSPKRVKKAQLLKISDDEKYWID